MGLGAVCLIFAFLVASTSGTDYRVGAHKLLLRWGQGLRRDT